jgi:hypothetical protein
MANPAGESNDEVLKLDFRPSIDAAVSRLNGRASDADCSNTASSTMHSA